MEEIVEGETPALTDEQLKTLETSIIFELGKAQVQKILATSGLDKSKYLAVACVMKQTAEAIEKCWAQPLGYMSGPVQ